MNHFKFILLLAFLFYLPFTVVKAAERPRLNNEKLLIEKLTKGYPQKLGRPLKNDSSGPVLISLKSQLIQIVKLEPTDQVLVTNIWNNFNWFDPYLVWDPKDYNGLSTIRIPANNAFQHDIILLNNADERLEYKREALLVIYSSGHILWIPRSIFSSTCHIDLKRFPFDRQNCTLSFGSWTYDDTLIDLEFSENKDKIDLNDYEKSKEWQIQEDFLYGTKSHRVQDGRNYTVLTYYIVINRNPGFYTYLLIVPCVLLAILTMVVFWLPPENPSKIILGMNIFAAFFLLLLLLAELVPTSSNEVPFIEWLARIYCMVPRGQTAVTERSLLNSGLLLGVKNVQNADKFEKFELLKERFKTYRENVLKIGFDNLLKTHPTITSSCNNVHLSNFNIYSSTSSSPSSSINNNLHKQNCACTYCAYCTQQQIILTEIAYLNNLEHDIKEIRDYLRDTRKKLEAREMKAKLASDWKQIALVLDRTFFYIYFIITIVTVISIFPSEIAHSKQKKAAMGVQSILTEAVSKVTEAVVTATKATIANVNSNNVSNKFLFF